MVSPEEGLAALKAKLKARENRPGFKANVEQLRARIAELESANEV